MERTRIKEFTSGSISKQLLSFSIPLFLSGLLQILYSTVDMIVVGKVYGREGTSAVAVGGDLVNLLTFVVIGFSNAGQVLIARYIGAKERQRLGRFVGTMSGFLLLCATGISAISLLLRDQILDWLNTPAESREGTVAYATVCMLGLVFIYGYNVVGAILRGMGDSKHPFLFIALASVTNLLLDILFVAVFRMGVGGAALATVISQGVSFLSCGIFLIRKRKEFELNFSWRDFVLWDRSMLLGLIRLGIPMAIRSAAIQFSKLFVSSYINAYGVAVSAFAGIANKLASFANLISISMTTAGSTMIGQNLVAEKYDRVKKIMLRIAAVTLSVATVFSVLICLFPRAVFGLFVEKGEESVLALVNGYLPISILLFFGSALRAPMNALVNGSGNHRINLATAILDGIVFRIGFSLLFGLGLGLGYYGFWLGDALAGLTPFCMGFLFYCSGAWRRSSKSKQ